MSTCNTYQTYNLYALWCRNETNGGIVYKMLQI